MKGLLAVAGQLFWQEKQSPHIRFLMWAQGVLMVFIIALGLTSTTIQSYLTDNLDSMLGADMVLVHPQPLDDEQLEFLQETAEQVVQTQLFDMTLTHKEQLESIQFKSVNQDYPLKGQLLATDQVGQEAYAALATPKKNEVWLDTRAVTALGLSVGDTLMINNQPLVLSKILVHEPDRLLEGHSVAMRGLVKSSLVSTLDIPSAQLTFRTLIAGSKEQVQTLIKWQKETLPSATVFHKGASHPLASFWQRTENFIGLTSILLFFMAAIAIEQISQVVMRKEQYFSAVCMSMGINRRQAVMLSVVKWVFHQLYLLPFVLVVAFICHWLLVDYLDGLLTGLALFMSFSGSLFDALFSSLVGSLLMMWLVMVIFQFPVWWRIWHHSAASLIRPQAAMKSSALLSKLASLIVLTAVALFYSDNGLLTAMVLASLGVTIGLILLFAWLILVFGEKLTASHAGLVPFTFFMMRQRLITKVTQVMGIGLSAFILLFTLMFMRDLGTEIDKYKRVHDGNLIVSQATKKQMTAIANWAEHGTATIRQQKAFITGKVIAVNQTNLSDYTDKPSDSLATLQRQIRLHWTDEVPSNNQVVAGSWWQPGTQNWRQISVENEVMTDLSLSLGDKLDIAVADQVVTFEIVASHAYRSGGGSITFWMQIPNSALAHLNADQFAMASLELKEADWSGLSTLWQQHPTLRMVSVNELTSRFDKMLTLLQQVSSGYAVIILLLAGIVIGASVQSLQRAERHKNGIIMSFGLTANTCLALNVIEWLVTASIAAFGAIGGTWLAGQLIYEAQFSMSYRPDVVWLSSTLALMTIAVVSYGLYCSHSSLKADIRELLAE